MSTDDETTASDRAADFLTGDRASAAPTLHGEAKRLHELATRSADLSDDEIGELRELGGKRRDGTLKRAPKRQRSRSRIGDDRNPATPKRRVTASQEAAEILGHRS